MDFVEYLIIYEIKFFFEILKYKMLRWMFNLYIRNKNNMSKVLGN